MGFTLNPIEFILIDLKRSTKNKNFFFFIKALKIKTFFFFDKSNKNKN